MFYTNVRSPVKARISQNSHMTVKKAVPPEIDIRSATPERWDDAMRRSSSSAGAGSRTPRSRRRPRRLLRAVRLDGSPRGSSPAPGTYGRGMSSSGSRILEVLHWLSRTPPRRWPLPKDERDNYGGDEEDGEGNHSRAPTGAHRFPALWHALLDSSGTPGA